MTYAPASIKAAQTYLHEVTGLPWVSLGIIGDRAHDGGYHCGEDRVDADDYSVDESPRDARGLTDAASALDIGNFTKGTRDLRHFSAWLVAECKAGAPDTLDIREVIYSLDGRTVHRWDRLGKRTTGDSSHRGHTHISYFRDSEHRDKVGLFHRYFAGARPSIPSTPSTPGTGVSPIGGIMLPSHGDSGEEVQFWQLQLLDAGEKLPRSGADGRWGDETTAAVRSFWKKVRPKEGFDGRRITAHVARELLRRNLAGKPGADGRDGVLRLPAGVQITGQITGLTD